MFIRMGAFTCTLIALDRMIFVAVQGAPVGGNKGASELAVSSTPGANSGTWTRLEGANLAEPAPALQADDRIQAGA